MSTLCKRRVVDALLILFTLSCVAAAIVVASRLGQASEDRADPTLNATQFTTLTLNGHVLGLADARRRIVVFSDFQCTFCDEMHTAIGKLLREDSTVSVVYRHFPLKQNPRAYAAALASECLVDEQQFFQFANLVYSKQDSLGRYSLSDFATQVGVRDSVSFQRCGDSERARTRVREDVAAATELRITGTPLLIVDGRLVRGAIPLDSLRSLLRAPPDSQ